MAVKLKVNGMKWIAEIKGTQKTIQVEPIARQPGAYRVVINERVYEVDAQLLSHGGISLLLNGRSYDISVNTGESKQVQLSGRHFAYCLMDEARARRVELTSSQNAGATSGRVVAPMPGKIRRVLANLEDEIHVGQGLMVIEAMKMENEIKSMISGRVRSIAVLQDQTVESGALLMVIE